MALLNVDKLSVHFGDENAPFRAVDRISYSVKQGEVVGIVGESGSGKSVSSLAIMGLIDYPGRVMADKLEFNGRDLQRISEKERRQLVGAEVAMIFQDPMTSLNPCFTVGFQIAETLVASFMSGADDDDDDPGDDGILGVDELHIVFTEFKSMLSQNAEARRIAPMVVEYVGEQETGPHTLVSFEPDADTLFGALLPRYVATRVYAALLEAAQSGPVVEGSREKGP